MTSWMSFYYVMYGQFRSWVHFAFRFPETSRLSCKTNDCMPIRPSTDVQVNLLKKPNLSGKLAIREHAVSKNFTKSILYFLDIQDVFWASGVCNGRRTSWCFTKYMYFQIWLTFREKPCSLEFKCKTMLFPQKNKVSFQYFLSTCEPVTYLGTYQYIWWNVVVKRVNRQKRCIGDIWLGPKDTFVNKPTKTIIKKPVFLWSDC